MEDQAYPMPSRQRKQDWLTAWLEPFFSQAVAVAMGMKLVLFLLMVAFLFGGYG